MLLPWWKTLTIRQFYVGRYKNPFFSGCIHSEIMASTISASKLFFCSHSLNKRESLNKLNFLNAKIYVQKKKKNQIKWISWVITGSSQTSMKYSYNEKLYKILISSKEIFKQGRIWNNKLIHIISTIRRHIEFTMNIVAL